MENGDNTAQKNQLQQQIRDKSSEVLKCERIRDRLSAEKGKLERYQTKWKGQYQKHNNSRIASQVAIKNVFEGIVADKLKGYYGSQVKNMCKTNKEMLDLCKELESQIRKINTHIADLKGEITSANTKLKGMEE